jgi:hypothetical protein
MRYNSSLVGKEENQKEDGEVNFKFKCEVTHLILFNVGILDFLSCQHSAHQSIRANIHIPQFGCLCFLVVAL